MSELPSDAEAEGFMHALLGPVGLHALNCPTCGTRFGMEREDVRFAEQTGEIVFCPRGHRLKLAAKEPSE